MAQRTLFIVNPAAGAGQARERWARFGREMWRAESSPETRITSRAGEAAAIAREAAIKYERVIAVGGDGTVSEVANGLLSVAGNQCALGIIPLGTGNDIAQTLGIRGLEDARRVLAADRRRIIDVIEVHSATDGQSVMGYALLFAGVGIVSAVLRKTTPLAKRLLGQSGAYRAGLLLALWCFHPLRMRIVCDGEVSEGHHLFLGASNGEKAGGGMRIAPGARIDDGLLNVNLVGAASRWEALKQLRRLSRGQHTSHAMVQYRTARSISIESDPPGEVAADGELIGLTPAMFVVKPKALAVLVAG